MPLKIHFLNVGRGDCTIVEFPSGRVGMVDIDNFKVLDEDTRRELVEEYRGSQRHREDLYGYSGLSLETRERELIKRAEERLTDPLEYYDSWVGPTRDVFRMIVTHPDMDHMTGLYRLHRQEPTKDIVNFWHASHGDFNLGAKTDWENSPYDVRDWQTYKELRASESYPKSLKMVKDRTGEYWTEDGVEIWAPTPGLEALAIEKDKPNIVSMILKIGYRGRSIVLGGDATAEETWPAIHPYIDMSGVDVLKASHHGRKSGYYQPAVKEMSPWLTITSVANESEHDATESYRRYSDHTVSLRKVGDIRITVEDDGTLRYSQNIEEHWRPKR
jgi:beta-lactamase superfamily II metal-dependent hydrolase